MNPENRALLAVLVAVAVVTSAVGAYLLLASAAPPTTLPVPAGTDFSSAQAANWTAHVAVGASGGMLTGAWTAYDGSGFIRLEVVNGTVSKPPNVYLCPLLIPSWTQQNGTVDVARAPGPYTVFWTTGYCSSATSIVVTQTIQVLPA